MLLKPPMVPVSDLLLIPCCLCCCCFCQVSKKRTKTAQQPAKSLTTSVTKKNGRRVLKSVAKEVAGYRADLKVRVLYLELGFVQAGRV